VRGLVLLRTANVIKLTQGDLLKQNDVDAIVNTVNCVGVMGKGIAL
jgi:O-acetyl-ADP-ribose deacetylase (regulator of RNase III)